MTVLTPTPVRDFVDEVIFVADSTETAEDFVDATRNRRSLKIVGHTVYFTGDTFTFSQLMRDAQLYVRGMGRGLAVARETVSQCGEEQ